MSERPTRDRPFIEIDHTADAGFLIHGSDLPALFRNAALCLFQYLGDVEGIVPTGSWTVQLEAPDREALLRQWLSELLYLSYVGKLVLVDASIEHLDGRKLEATARGVAYDPDRHERSPEVKAVTYHGLAIRATADGLEATIILDL